MRIHPDAAQVTAPLRASAVTIGQDIYFHPGHYRPGTPEGDRLIAHEFAHTEQTRQTPVGSTAIPGTVSQPGDAVEKNAEALATGKTNHVLNAPAGMALRTPLDGESSDDAARRERLVRYVHTAEANLIRLLQTGGLLTGEEVTAERSGTRGVIVPASTLGRSDENFVSYTERNTIIRRVIRNLVAMATYYRTHPIPGALPPAVTDEHNTVTTTIANPEGSSHYGADDADFTQLQAAYELYLISTGTWDQDSAWIDQIYIDVRRTITPGAARGAPRIGRGIQSGAYMVFPNVDDEPYRYWRLDGFSPIPEGSEIIEFWHDDIGYYYMNDGERIDVPSPWSSSRTRTP